MSQGVECYSCLPKTAWPPTSPLAPWYEEADFVNTDRGAHPYADRPGRSHDRMGAARHAMEPEVSVERRELEQFTRRLADYLEDARARS